MSDSENYYLSLLEDHYPNASDLCYKDQTYKELYLTFKKLVGNGPYNKYTTSLAWKDLQVLSWVSSGGITPIKYVLDLKWVMCNDDGVITSLESFDDNILSNMMKGLGIPYERNNGEKVLRSNLVWLIHREVERDRFWTRI